MFPALKSHPLPSRLFIGLAIGLALSSPSFAEDNSASGPDEVEEDVSILDVTIGGGAAYSPDYEGSDDYEIDPVPYVELSFFEGLASLSVGGLQVMLPIGDQAFVGAGVGYGGGREEDANDDLEGLGDVDDTIIGNLSGGLKLGPGAFIVSHTQDLGNEYDGYSIDFGVETGLELIEEKAEITLGAGATWGSGGYNETFFGISQAQAAASGLDEFDADEGFKSVGVELGGTYAITDNLLIGFEAGYQRLVGDVADSPIVDDRGSPNQFSIATVLALTFDLL